jgi:hypothetical protein
MGSLCDGLGVWVGGVLCTRFLLESGRPAGRTDGWVVYLNGKRLLCCVMLRYEVSGSGY